MTDVPAQTGIHLKTSYFWMAFLLAFFKPKVSIDGSQPAPGVWGNNFYAVPPGAHRINVWFNYLFFGKCGKAELVVQVPAGAVLPLAYRAPTWFVFSPGKLAVEANTPPGEAAGAPPASASAPTPAAEPQWDERRNAWVQYDTSRQAWIQYDEATRAWGPLR
jgi:hypothetical protein